MGKSCVTRMTLFCVAGMLLASCATRTGGQTKTGEETVNSNDCASGFSNVLRSIEETKPEDRLSPSLQGLATACPDALGNLAQAAQQFSSVPRAQRAAQLAEAASFALPPACATTAPLSPATSLTWSCPPPDELELDPELLQTLDSGTYLFVIAVRARLSGAEVLDAAADKLLTIILTSASLEGKASAAEPGNGAIVL